MNISIAQVDQVLARFELVFGEAPGVSAGGERKDVVELWHGLLATYPADLFFATSLELVRQLKRFPFPSDFIEKLTAHQLEPATEAAPAAKAA